MADNFLTRFLGRLRPVQAQLSTRALDDPHDRLLGGAASPRDRRPYDREEVLRDALEAWRVNPIARRVVELTSQYVVGGGLQIECKHEHTHRFLQEWWAHRLNNMDTRVFEWCDELSRSGELFIILSTDQAGMTYVRAIPAAQIQEIETAENDLEQETLIWEKPSLDGQTSLGPEGLRGRAWKAYNPENDRPENGAFDQVMVHYAVNRPVGGLRGESDLAPLLRWLARYSAWLEDRARLNRYRNTFIFWVKARFASAEDRLRRQAELNANPPNPGSILVSDESETWSVLNPTLQSAEAAEDGLALKKMISAGSGIPLHFIAEPESATRTTAESAGGPTFRRYQQRQLYFLWLVQDLARIVLQRRKYYDRRINLEAELVVNGSDISARDNASLAVAASTVTGAFLTLRDRGLIDDAELLRLAYRFAGEVVDVEAMLRRGQAAGTTPAAGTGKEKTSRKEVSGNLRPAGIKIDPISGEPKGIDA